jgi:shikimate kinase
MAFAHVLWIGGASDAGKSTVARLLAERHRWQCYPCDFHEHNHLIARADPERQPAIYAEFQKSVEERWIQPTPEDLFQCVLETNDERFPMILDDLRSMPQRPMILVEGPRLFPKLVATLLTSAQQAVWLMPTPEFARESVERRDKPHGRFETSDPECYRANFLRRDALLAEYIRREVAAHGLTMIEVDGSRSPDEVADQIDAHFAPYLASRPGN